MSLEGTQLGHYRLTQFLKGGGMGEVYLAEDLTLPRQVAIKVMKSERALYPDSQTAQDAERLFQREMGVIAALDHPNILTLHEAGKQNVNHDQVTYMVMPYCPAGSLADWMGQYHSNSLLSPQEVSQLLLQAGEALQHAHDQYILHLDIKPQNFLVRRQQDPTASPNLLLADFGVSKITNTTQMSGTPRGTVAYMAPEQLGMLPVPASDQYALAIMVYELLTGRRPFEGANMQVVIYQHANMVPDPPSKANSSLPQVLDPIILRALAKKPEERFDSVREFAQAFAAALRPEVSRPSQGSREYAGGGYVGVTQTTPEQIASQSQQAVLPPPPPPYMSPSLPSSQQSLPSLPLQSQQAVPPPPPPPYMSPSLPSSQQSLPLLPSSQQSVPPPPLSYPQSVPPYAQRQPSNVQKQPPSAWGQPPNAWGQQQAMRTPQLPIKQRRKRKLGFWWALGLGIGVFVFFGGASPHSSPGASFLAIIVFIVCLYI